MELLWRLGGATGGGLIVTDVAAEIHPLAFLTVTLYIPDATLVKIPVVLVYVVPSILYAIPAAGAGVLTVIVPVVVAQVVG